MDQHSRVTAHMTMSLDGYIATESDGIEDLFEWYGAGPIEVPTANPGVAFRLDAAGADMMRTLMGNAGALVSGRHLFDITDGWGDRHPIGTPVVVVTHAPPADADRWPNTTFVDGVAAAVEQARVIAAGRDVVLSSADIVGQALDEGLLDEVAVSLVPVLLGRGKAYFGSLTRGPVRLDDPTVVAGTRATHLRYRVTR